MLLVDGDPQGTVANAPRVRPAGTLTDLLTGTEVAKVVSAGVRPNLDVIAATPTAFGLDGAQLAGALIQRETVLRRALAGLSHYDVVILDTSPAMGLLDI